MADYSTAINISPEYMPPDAAKLDQATILQVRTDDSAAAANLARDAAKLAMHDELVAMLEAMEISWLGCPCCGKSQNHSSRCELAALLDKARKLK